MCQSPGSHPGTWALPRWRDCVAIVAVAEGVLYCDGGTGGMGISWDKISDGLRCKLSRCVIGGISVILGSSVVREDFLSDGDGSSVVALAGVGLGLGTASIFTHTLTHSPRMFCSIQHKSSSSLL